MAQTELALGGHKSACESVGQYEEASEGRSEFLWLIQFALSRRAVSISLRRKPCTRPLPRKR